MLSITSRIDHHVITINVNAKHYCHHYHIDHLIRISHFVKNNSSNKDTIISIDIIYDFTILIHHINITYLK